MFQLLKSLEELSIVDILALCTHFSFFMSIRDNERYIVHLTPDIS